VNVLFALRWLLLVALLAVVGWLAWASLRHDHS